MSRDELIQAVKKAASNNRLTCEAAHDLSRALIAPIEEIGAICNELKIKITACRLGCF